MSIISMTIIPAVDEKVLLMHNRHTHDFRIVVIDIKTAQQISEKSCDTYDEADKLYNQTVTEKQPTNQ